MTPLDDKELAINEDHMEEIISKGVNVYNDGPNGMPDPEEDPKDDDKEPKMKQEDEEPKQKAKMQDAMKEIEKGLIDKDVNPNMEVGLEAIHLISPEARK